jgi:hypothetical protein
VSAPVPNETPEALRDRWLAAWPAALAAWSRFTRLRPPALCLTSADAQREGLRGSFAMIRLADQAVVVDLQLVAESGVAPFAVEVLAHEVGHHVLAPATLTDHARMLARMRRALPTVEHHAPMVANLYTDLLINDRLQRSAGLRLSAVDQALARRGAEPGAMWTLYLRTYELLWSLERGALGGGATDDRIEGDAWLAARLVRSYARHWLDGSGRFAALLLTYLLEDAKSVALVRVLLDTAAAGAGGEAAGLTEEDAAEREGAVHPALDPELAGDDATDGDGDGSAAPADTGENAPARGQAREPFEYGAILKAAGIELGEHEAAVRYYRERARPHLVRYPSRRAPESEEPLPEGLEPWDVGDAIDEVDWLQSILVSPRVVPGLTTVRRVWGTTGGAEARRTPLDLDIYVDSSGSMVNPQQRLSYPALAGAVVCLSALRAGARVQATLWSGVRQVMTTGAFVRDEGAILRVLTGYLGGGTAFPIHVLRDTYAARPAGSRPAHVLVVSDDGVTTMFENDERGRSGWDVAAAALRAAGGGGTLVLNLPEHWERAASQADADRERARKALEQLERTAGAGAGANLRRVFASGASQVAADLLRARAEGWNVHRVATWDDLLAFARDFSRRAYADDERAAPRRAGEGRA